MTCVKCETYTDLKGKYYEVGEEIFDLCSYCSSAVDEFANGDVKKYLEDENVDLVTNPILRNIIMARIRRSKKKSVWK
jgi:hypothetical protein